jgi:hypothetical protein
LKAIDKRAELSTEIDHAAPKAIKPEDREIRKRLGDQGRVDVERHFLQ